MHELAIVHGIVDAVTERSGGDRIVRVVVEVGRLTAVLPDALRFCFEVVAQGTAAEGASLDILETDGETLRVREMEVA
jgi:hydrogenase nickel incorporation protein HypA/HybF